MESMVKLDREPNLPASNVLTSSFRSSLVDVSGIENGASVSSTLKHNARFHDHQMHSLISHLLRNTDRELRLQIARHLRPSTKLDPEKVQPKSSNPRSQSDSRLQKITNSKKPFFTSSYQNHAQAQATKQKTLTRNHSLTKIVGFPFTRIMHTKKPVQKRNPQYYLQK